MTPITFKYAIEDEEFMDFVSGKRSIGLKCPDCGKIMRLEMQKVDFK